MRISIKVETKNLDKVDAQYLRKGITNVLKIGAEQIRRTAQELAPKDTGELSESIHSYYCGPMKYRIEPDKPPIDLYMEEGTRPHGIDGHPLLYWEGAMHPVPHVNHPGTEAYKYMEEAMIANADAIVAMIEAEIDRLL